MTQEEELKKLRDAVDYINKAETQEERMIRKTQMFTVIYGTPMKLKDLK